MATYSSNLNLKKPGYSDPADIADINNNMDLIDAAVDNNSGSMADKYDETSTYDAGERCVHDNKLYKAKIDISTAETWNADHWDEVKISDEIDDTNQAVAKLSEGMTYVVNGNKSIESATIPVGSYVRLVNSTITGRSDGIYTVATAIPVDTAIDGTYFNENAPIPGGVANALNSKMATLLWEDPNAVSSEGAKTISLPTAPNYTFVVVQADTCTLILLSGDTRDSMLLSNFPNWRCRSVRFNSPTELYVSENQGYDTGCQVKKVYGIL